jgi:succinoglycan biosynthesis protein ExoM
MIVSICVATHRRPRQLGALLEDLARQRRPPQEVVVVDNDATASARAVVRRAAVPFPIRYATEPRTNVAIARNRTVALARGDWLAFVDDDERAPPEWLERLVAAARRFRADGVLGPVEPVLPATAADWLQRGGFYDWVRMRTGAVVPVKGLRFGNVLVRAALLRTRHPPFDPAYGLTGGEDGDLLARLVTDGARIIWCDEAVVREPVDPARQSLRWILLRALRGGQTFARHVLAGHHGPPTAARQARLLLRAAVQLVAAGALALLSLPLGRHVAARWLARACANLGKVSAFVGLYYREYAR